VTTQSTNNQDSTTQPSLITDAIVRFSAEQTLTNIGELRKFGVGLKILNNNKWERLSEYKLPFERWVALYDDSLKICDIGVY
jgi:hypothetical protein